MTLIGDTRAADRLGSVSSGNALELRGVTKMFGALAAIADVTLTVGSGERRAVLGSNGAGKTTLFNCVTGDFLPTSGTIRLFGEDVTQFPAYERVRRGLRRTYQISLLFNGLTAADNVYLACRGVSRGRFSFLRPRENDELLTRADELIEAVHLTEWRDTSVANLSYGQQRQLEIALALAGAPRLILFDEPAAGLSPTERAELVAILNGLPGHIGYIIIEHDMDVALRVAESVTMMHNGRIFKEGTPEEIENDEEVQELYLGDGHSDRRESRRAAPAALEVRGLNVYYGASHALQGVDLQLETGVLSVVGRNGMGKTTLCKTIMGLVPVASGSVSYDGQPLAGRSAAEIARMGIGYVPQGRRLWRSLTVDEHLKMVEKKGGAWSSERIYSTFPRLAERKRNGGAQLSGGEQQMLAIARALLSNPRLLIMDEPTEGLAPVIVAQVEEMLLTLAAEGEMDVLVIEQNIGVACAVADQVAIMVNGRINRLVPAAELAADRDLQQRLLGVGRHAHDDTPESASAPTEPGEARRPVGPQTAKVYMSNPKLPTRWSAPVPVPQIERAARVITTSAPVTSGVEAELRPLAAPGENVVLVAGTLDTKGDELRYMRNIVRAAGLPVRMVDLSTSGGHSGAEIPAHQIAAFHPRGAAGVFTGDRGQSVAGMTEAFTRWMARQDGVMGILSAGGSGGTAIVSPAMRTLPVGVPKMIVSTVASGEVSKYVGPADITMMYSVADVQGLNAITEEVLGNAANAIVGMVKARQASPARQATKPAIGLTMFGVTTTAIQQITKDLGEDFDCLVFHATGIGGQAMEKLIDSGKIRGVIDLTTTEICDMMMGGVFPATEDRFGAVIRRRMPYVGSVGALDMVNFGAPQTVPEKYRDRTFYEHNPQVTLMRTTAEECTRMGRWIGGRLNEMKAPVRFFLPEGGVSALDANGQPFDDPTARRALFTALEDTVRQTSNRRLIRLPHNINDPQFAAAVVSAFREFHGGRPNKRKEAQK